VKRSLLAIVAAAFAARLLAAEPASLSLYLFDDSTPLAAAEVRIDGNLRGSTNSDGALRLQLEAGSRTLQVLRDGVELLLLELDFAEAEDAELIATLAAGAPPRVSIESSHQRDAATAPEAAAPTDAGPPGALTGRITSSEDGKPIAGARVYVAGTPLDIVTDAEGRYTVPISAGSYSLSVLAPNYSPITLYDIAVAPGEPTERPIELVPAGLDLPDFVVLEPFVEGSLAAFVEERRTSSAVTDILGAEQISRAGDSDAAGALKRVTGLTLVDGRFVYVRGLGERYSSTLLNGAQVPSPDPTRRVVPLDLFPADVLAGIVVQKTYSADMPAEFGGGTIQLRTRGVPDAFFMRGSLGIAYADGTTGRDGLRYDGGHRDWTGRDDGAREAPSVFGVERLPGDPLALQAAGRELAALGYGVRADSLDPNGSFGFGVGDAFSFADGWLKLGYITALRYAHAWDDRTETRRSYSLFGDRLLVAEDLVRRQTERNIDSSLFTAFGARIGEHHAIDATFTRLRQTTDEVQIDEGVLGSGNIDRITTLQWVENRLDTAQLAGEHAFPMLGNLQARWQYTDAQAARYSPNTREFRFTFDDTAQQFFFESFNQQRIDTLADDARDYTVDLKWPWVSNDTVGLDLMAGIGRMERERDSRIRRFRFSGRRPPGDIVEFEDLLQPGNIGPTGLRLEEGTLATDAYTASQSLAARYLAVDARWRDWRLNLGMRQEDMLQRVVTRRPFDPNATPQVGLLDNSDRLPAGTLTWAYSDAAQLRLAYSRTLSRPDIREQSPANFVDPLLDVRVEGNPNLRQAGIENVDLRWEYYFSPLESFSVALFRKQFTDPIELVSVPASGFLLQIRNAEQATNTGIEFDLYRSLGMVERFGWLPGPLRRLPWQDLYVGANYARIQSEIDLGDSQGIQTNALRPLQGQSKYVGNLSFGYQHPEGRTEATVLYNVFGERIARVGVSGLPDVYDEPLGQLDFTFSQALPAEAWRIKLRLRNLLDPTVRQTQGGAPTREFRRGREAQLSVEWRF
jgi:hypothetical protein